MILKYFFLKFVSSVLCVCSLRSQALTVCGIRGREKAWNISRWGIFGIAMTNGVLMEPEFPSP